jgi:hypothetical protein
MKEPQHLLKADGRRRSSDVIPPRASANNASQERSAGGSHAGSPHASTSNSNF